MTFEEALARLNQISGEMDNPEVTLKRAVEPYSEASELIDICRKGIGEARLSLEKVSE